MDLKGHLTEYEHLNQQGATNQESAPFAPYLGNIQSYDVETNTVVVLNPINSNPDQDNTPMQSPPMPLAVGMAGLSSGDPSPAKNAITRWGFQITPFGGSSLAQPLVGEQVLVLPLNPDNGYSCCAFLVYNTQAQPPGGHDMPVIGGQMASGEALFVNPVGTLIYVDINGNIKVVCQTNDAGNANQTGNLQAVVNGGISLRTAVPDTPPDDPEQFDIDVSAHQDINETATRDINMVAQKNINSTTQDEDITETSGRDILEGAINDIDSVAGNDITQTATRDIVRTATRNIEDSSTVDTNLTVGGNYGVSITLAINVTAGGDITMQSQTNIILAAPSIQASALGETVYRLCTEVFLELFNQHTHDGVLAGPDITGTPTIPVLDTYPNLTEVFEAG